MIGAEKQYKHPDEAIRHLFRLHETVDSIQSNTGPQGVAGDRCRYCGQGPAITVSRDSVSEPVDGMLNHWKKICVECRKPWEGIPWYEVTQTAPRQSSGPVTVYPRSSPPFVVNSAVVDARDTWIQLGLFMGKLDKRDKWQWRVYGVLYIGFSIGASTPTGSKAPQIERRTAVGQRALKEWRGIPKHHISEWGVRKLVHEGRRNLHEILRDAGLMPWGRGKW